MSGRASGYHYVTLKDGTRKRVYNNNKKVKASPAVKSVVARKALQGQGGYYDSGFVKTMNKYVPKGAFKKVGGVIGGLYGNGALGAKAGEYLSKIAGFGAYKVNSNSLMINEGDSPAYMHSTNSSLKVRHREYIADVVSSGTASAFSNVSYNINPGLATSFPWLSSIAQQYEQFVVKGMVYEFKSLSSDAVVASSANSYIGGVILATNYNAVSAPFTNKQQMENAEYTTSSKPSECVYHPIECKPGSMPTQQLYVRTGSIPANSDARMYDLGIFQIATFGVSATNVILGELWCTYEIEFSKPISTAVSGVTNLTDHFRLATIGNLSPLGTASVLANNSSIGGTITNTGTTYNFPVGVNTGKYLFTYVVLGNAATITPPLFSVSGGSILSYWNNDNDNQSSIAGSTTSNRCFMNFIISLNPVPGTQAAVNFSTTGSLPTSAISGDLWVTQIDGDISS